MYFILPESRQQITLINSLDGMVTQDHYVRLIDFLIDTVIKTNDGIFISKGLAKTGRKPYHPATLLKLYGYYLSESSGDLAQRAHVLPNDTVYIPMDSLTFPGTSKNFHKGIFTWDFGNGKTSHSPCPKFIYYAVGNYLVTVNYSDTIEKINGQEEQTYVVLEHPTIPEIYGNTFTIEPNPGTGIFTIIAKNAAVIGALEVTDATGKLCLKEILPEVYTFNISSLASGVYFVKIMSNGLTYYNKIVKY
jgi:Secretion system C-terminal sorting domain/PKD domain